MKLVFLGTAGDSLAINSRSPAGLLLVSDTIVCIDPGPGTLHSMQELNLKPSKISAILKSTNDIHNSHDYDALVWAKSLNGLEAFSNNLENPFVKTFEDNKKSFFIRYPECTILYASTETKLPQSDILITTFIPKLSFLKSIQPKITILTKLTDEIIKKNPVYVARELSKDFKVIAAADNMVITPEDYSALDNQKSLDLFSNKH